MKAYLFLLLALLPSPHGELDEQIHALSEKIAKAPQQLELRIRRGELLRIHGAAFDALIDFDYVLMRAPENHEIRFFKALALRDLKRHQAARRELDRFLATRPDHPEGLRLSARLYGDLGETKKETEVWAQLFKSEARLSPDDAFAWLHASDGAHQVEKERDISALVVLARAKEQLGAAVTLELEAARREARLGRWTDFDRRFAALKQSARKKDWFVQQQERLYREYHRP